AVDAIFSQRVELQIKLRSPLGIPQPRLGVLRHPPHRLQTRLHRLHPAAHHLDNGKGRAILQVRLAPPGRAAPPDPIPHVEPAPPTPLSTESPAPMTGEAPPRPGSLNASPLVVVTPPRSPALSSARQFIVP